ncbi:MAG: hypothetical protein CBC24_02880 [Candidatus Pelagibacter sp. TMED64]|nr:hypothetical protein [Candidatus Pelagibacter sp.]OUU66682.1 MAG: hypothetical protein CBC24_02880 [Candidatus Pelagibacter sp. TMED64]|tara:strand:- start:2190 stop:6359 length:4170 start_codon:yes stop_codon:yes gene_type:complete
MAAAAPIIGAITSKGIGGAILRFALSLAVSYITQKLFAPDMPGVEGGAGSGKDPGVKQRIPSDPSNKLPVVYGQDKIHGSIIFADITSDNKTMAFIIALCEGPINKIGTSNYGTNSGIYWDDYELSFDLAGNVINATHADGGTDSWLNGNLKIVKYPDGGRCLDMETFSSKWNSGSQNRHLPDVAYAYVELNYDREDNVTGLTSKLGFEVEGKLIRTISSAPSLNGPTPTTTTIQGSLANPNIFDTSVKFANFSGYQLWHWVNPYNGGVNYNYPHSYVAPGGTYNIIDLGPSSDPNAPYDLNDYITNGVTPTGLGTGGEVEFDFINVGEQYHLSNGNLTNFTPNSYVDSNGVTQPDDGRRLINAIHFKQWGNNYSNSFFNNVSGNEETRVWIEYVYSDAILGVTKHYIGLSTIQFTPTGGIYANYTEEDYGQLLANRLNLSLVPNFFESLAPDGLKQVGIRKLRDITAADSNGVLPTYQYSPRQQYFTAKIPQTVQRTLYGTYSTNPAECLADYLTNKVYGCGQSISDNDLDLDTFYAHKVFCDTSVTHNDPDGNSVTSKRYQCNGYVNTNDSKDLNISDIVSNSQSIFSYTLGKFQMLSDTTGSISYGGSNNDFDETSIYGDVTVVNDGFNSTLNEMNLQFKSKINEYQDDQVFLEYGNKYFNEPVLSKDLTLKFINTNVEAQRIGTVIMNKSRSNKIISFKTDTRAANLQVNDIISVKGTYYNLDKNSVFSHNFVTNTSNGSTSNAIGEYVVKVDSNQPYIYEDTQEEARFYVPGTVAGYEKLSNFYKDCINGQFFDSTGQLTDAQVKLNNKLGEIFSFVSCELDTVSSSYGFYGAKLTFYANDIISGGIKEDFQIDVITNILNSTWGSLNVINTASELGSLFKINSISETELNGGLQGYFITAQEYNANDYTVGTLTATAAAPPISSTRGYQNLGVATNLVLNNTFPSATTPYIDVSFTMPSKNNVEGVEIYYGSGVNTPEASRILVQTFSAPTGNYAGGSTQNFNIQNIPTTTDLYIWVRLTNSFSRGAFSTGLTIGNWNPTTNITTIGNNSIAPVLLGFDYNQYRNLIINGDFLIHQRGSSSTTSANPGYLLTDMWYSDINNSGTWVHSHSNDTPNNTVLSRSYKLENTTVPTLGASSKFKFKQIIEGQNLQKLKYGTTNAEDITVTFWVKSSKTGNYIFDLYNHDNNRHISKLYTIDNANVWEQKLITIPGDTNNTSAFDNDNNKSLEISWWLTSGSDFNSGTLNTNWNTTADDDRAVGQVNLADTVNNTWFISGIQLEVGSNASKFEIIPFDKSLERCQRYFYKLVSIVGEAFQGHSSSHLRHMNIWFPVTMRDTPTIDATWSTGTSPTNLSTKQYANVCINIGSNSTSASLTGFSASAELT